MPSDNPNRELLSLAILAFDLIVQDCIEETEAGLEFHPVSRKVLEHLLHLLNNRPPLPALHQDYIVNVSDISARIKLLFLSSEAPDEELKRIIEIQEEKLEILGKGREPHEEPAQARIRVAKRQLH